jgi:hypothetical protein
VQELEDVASRMAKRDELAIALRETGAIRSLLDNIADEVRQGAVCRVKDSFLRAEDLFQAARRLWPRRGAP